MRQPFCLYCRTALHGTESCDPEHPVVDLATPAGRDQLHAESFVTTSAVAIEHRAWTWKRLLPMGLLVAGFAFVAAGQFFAAVVIGMVAGVTIALSAIRDDSSRAPARPKLRAVGARALPTASTVAEHRVGTIVSGIPMPGPFTGQECVGWIVEIALAEAGVMLRDGETRGLGVELRDGHVVHIAPGMLRMHLRARSDSMSSDAIATYLASLDLAEELIRWDEARALELRVGDHVELTAEFASREVTGYRESAPLALRTLDVPFVRRV